MSSSRRSKKALALAKYRQDKSKGQRGGLDDLLVIREEEDVYDRVDEDDYKQLVESRRQREDFVVDDDGLGYHDDGEERLGDEEFGNEPQERRKRSSGRAELTAKALKRARKTRALVAEHDAMREEGAAAAAAEGNNRSMWEFVKRGNAVSSHSSSRRSNQHDESRKAKSVDDLLGQLDDLTPTIHHSRSSRSSNKQRRTMGRRSRQRRQVSYQPPPPVDRVRTVRRVENVENAETIHNDGNDSDDYAPPAWDDDDDDNGDVQPLRQDDEDEPMQEPTAADKSKPSTTEKVAVPTPDKPSEEYRMQPTFEKEPDPKPSDPVKPSEESAPAPRRRPGRLKLGQLSEPARKALEEQKRQKKSIPAATKPAVIPASLTSMSFKPQPLATEPASSPATQPVDTKLEAYLQSDPSSNDDNDSKFLDMYWIDVSEKHGEITLYGKTPVPNSSPSKFVSCCVVVKNNVRNLFVLPRRTDDGEYENMANVHKEINSLIKGPCIPHVAGASWAGKVVKRNYAFGDGDIPREETPYFKVIYDAKYPVPEEKICQEGGKTFSKILGAGASTLENFILKRKLMGPCWIRIHNPLPNSSPVSWCPVEMHVDNPKNIKTLTFGAPRPPPPMTTVSIKIKTVVNPKTHKSEIVSVSAVCHKHVLLDTASEESDRHMTQISLIRPLEAGRFPRDFDSVVSKHMPQLKREVNERALLSRLMTQIGSWDPDVIVAHNAWGFDVEVLLSRCTELKVAMVWSKLGRRRRAGVPTQFKKKQDMIKDWAIADVMSGRLLCDTYLSAKELLHETTYSLTHLSATQLKTSRQEIEPVDIPQWFERSDTIVQLALHTLLDAQLVQRLMFKLQILPLTKQLTCTAGNLWSHTLKSNRAERTEYLLLHEFHRLKYLPPEKARRRNQEGGGRAKAKYLGGLVLEPKKGLYDSFILLLDFNSLYPSLIQEYNLCFTTIDWSKYTPSGSGDQPAPELPPIPDEAAEQGVLPRVIKSLVERRRNIKKLLKAEKNPEKKQELDIRQKALKLTANSMYGCLGFSNSRFYAQPIAAKVTAMGRETLQRTVTIAQDSLSLEVIYGDTDSIMINTLISGENNLSKVKEIGEKVKREVNKMYRTLELEIDGIFRSMLLLKKKKYAARTVIEGPNGITYGQELKGLDLVRRDWCIQSKDTGRFVTEQILSGEDREVVLNNIHSHLEELAQKMRQGQLALEKYTITKGLSKHPNEYPDAKSQAHVQVAKMLLKQNRPVNTGDHISYIITAPQEVDQEAKTKKADESIASRARHPDDIVRSAGTLKPDVEWYLTQQILPPVSRLCEPIEGTSQSILAAKLGLDSSRYKDTSYSGGGMDDEDEINYKPESQRADKDRFENAEKLKILCNCCGVQSEFPGVFFVKKQLGAEDEIVTGLNCVNPECPNPYLWGFKNRNDLFSHFCNSMALMVHKVLKDYYQGVLECDEPMCRLKTRQTSVVGDVCLNAGCHGRLHPVITERMVHQQLKYLDTLCDFKHACKQIKQFGSPTYKEMKVKDLEKLLASSDAQTLELLHARSQRYLKGCAYNWITKPFWMKMMGVKATSTDSSMHQ